MLLQNPSTARAQWYDRNPVQIVKASESGFTAPHAGTTRWTYTVPTGRKCAIGLMNLKVTRSVAATTTGLSEIQLNLTPSGGSSNQIAECSIWNGGIGADQSYFGGTTMLMLAGDLLNCSDQDSSAGGNVNYASGVQGIEFDA